MSFHDAELIGSIHIPHNWTYANAVARQAATGFVATDVYKLAVQLDDSSIWVLTSVAPMWTCLCNSSSAAPSYYNESNGESSKTGVGWAEKVKLTFTPVELAYYEISFSGLLSISNKDKGFQARMQIDDTITKKEILETVSLLDYGDDGWVGYSGNFVVQLSVASHDIDLDFKPENTGDTAYVKEAVITARRIG